MRNNRLGCFSATAISTALITLVAISGIAFARGNRMFSPGPLNSQEGATLGAVSSHAETGGDCGSCHVAPWSAERMADRCADCHPGIVSDMSKVAQVHGAMLHDDPNLDCAHCHPEHRGPFAPLTLEVTSEDFPHAVLGYSLSGHAFTIAREPFVCRDCHVQDLSQFDQAACEDCHLQMDLAFTQAHSLSWGNDCLACHDGVDTYTRHFDHGKVPFVLMGAHVEVNCYTCHTDARSLVDLREAPQDCVACHLADEPHETRFGMDCGHCHSMDAWIPAEFDHNLADFKLEGKHIDVACQECHKTKPYRGTPMECIACHAKDDEHAGSFGTECVACHKLTGWGDSPFNHNTSSFPLVAGHADLACESCHKEGQYAGLSTSCVSCHGYPGWHGSAFGANCLACHTTTNWGRAKYTLGHPWFSHPNEDGVSMSGCRTCHPSSVYDADCSSCHDGIPGD